MITVDRLSKSYSLNSDFSDLFFKSVLKGSFLHSIFRERPKKKVLDDVSFEVGQGEVVGVIGRNGAGKSTLLKILSGITKPTDGHFRVDGRVASLLEVGTGFHPELTGRENIYLNAAILGMTRQEVRRKFEEIVDFSGVSEFLDTPVKRYSSGMYVRLAFSVAAHLEQEILIVDEVLAVGDYQFQKKCLEKMSGVAASGRTVLFVSHNFDAVRKLCSRGIVLKNGAISFDGSVNEAIADYIEQEAISYKRTFEDIKNANIIKQIYIEWPKTRRPNTNSEVSITTHIDASNLSEFERINPQICLSIRDKFGSLVTSFISDYQGLQIKKFERKLYKIKLKIPKLSLTPSIYSLDIKYWVPGELVAEEASALTFEVDWENRSEGLDKWDSSLGSSYMECDWEKFCD